MARKGYASVTSYTRGFFGLPKIINLFVDNALWPYRRRALAFEADSDIHKDLFLSTERFLVLHDRGK